MSAVCPHLRRRYGRVTSDQPDVPDRGRYLGRYCEHPAALQYDQPMRTEDEAKCEQRGAGPCWCGPA